MQLARAAEDPLVRKRTIEEVDDGGPSGFVDENETIEEAIRRVTTPWSHLPYALQVLWISLSFAYHDLLANDMKEKCIVDMVADGCLTSVFILVGVQEKRLNQGCTSDGSTNQKC